MSKTYYVWDEENDSLLEEIDENGNVIASYTNEPGPFGKVISQERNGVTSYYHYDGQGNTVALTDDNENITDTYIYTAYGELVSSTGTTVNPFRYGGQYGYYTDVETNDIYIRARSYNPSLGRWLTRDPIGYRGSEWGLYGYGKTNPTRYVEWDGKSPQDPVPPIDKPIPGGGANWDCTTKKAENRKQQSFPVILNTCCKGTLDVFVYAVRCFEPGWEDGGVNRVPPNPVPSDAVLAQHFYTKVEVRFRLGGFTPAGCGEDKRWSSSSCDVYPGRFLSALTGDWVTWPPVGNPLEMIDFSESKFLGAACESTKNVPPGTTR